jgi:hypothetical protein
MLNLKHFFNPAGYVSPLDQFLSEYDQTHPTLSLSQHQEKQKYNHIFHLRDIPTTSNNSPKKV